jgi:desulfoferrodoxin-like iron-binding protein
MRRKSEKEVKKMLNKVGQIYVCEICGNKVEILVAGKGGLVCCGQPMKLVGEKK